MIRLRLLGPLELHHENGEEIRSVVAQPKRLALLAYLAVHAARGSCRRDTLLCLFWPEMDGAHARGALSRALYYLRRSLGEGVLLGHGEEDLGLDKGRFWSDVSAFEKVLDQKEYREALSLYRGDLLEGVFVSDAPEFERWVEQERLRLRRHAADAAWKLADAAMEANETAEALIWTRRGYGLVPAEESALRRLVILLERMGERAQAVREYEEFAQRLRAEYDLEPSAETQALLSEMRSREAPLVLTRAAPASSENSCSDPMHVQAAPPPEPVCGISPPSVASGSSPGSWQSDPVRKQVSVRSSTAVRPWRRWREGAVVMLLIAAAYAALPLNGDAPPIAMEDRVIVAAFENRTGEPGLDLLGDMAADWITQGLQQTDLLTVVDPLSALITTRAIATDSTHLVGLDRAIAVARAAGARAVVWGAVYQRSDSVLFRAQITDVREGRLLLSLDPVTAPLHDPIAGTEPLRERVAGALASLLDERIASLSSPSSRPPTLDAYREYVRGLELFVGRDQSAAIPHFQTAARLDSTFSLPLVWAAFAYGNNRMYAEKDSVVGLLTARHGRLSPLDRHALDYMLAEARGDVGAMHHASRQAARIAPGSNWSYMAGVLSLNLMRPREGIQWLNEVDPERGWAKGWFNYWEFLSAAHHHLAQHAEELEAAHRGRRIDPENPYLRLYEIRALIALGRLEEVDARLDELFLLPPAGNTPLKLVEIVAGELRAHGHTEKAREVLDRTTVWLQSPLVDNWIRTQDDTAKARLRIQGSLASALLRAEQWEDARELYTRLATARSGDRSHQGALGLIAAKNGERAAALSVVRALEPLEDAPRGVRRELARDRARIAAVLGEQDLAMGFITEFLRTDLGEGYVIIHTFPEFENLYDYPPLQSLIRPQG